MTRQNDVTRAIQHTVFIPSQAALEEIVAEFAVGKRVDVDQDQAFFAIGNHRIIIDWVESLFLVNFTQFFGVARRRDRLVGRQRHAGRIFGVDMRILAKRREWCLDDAFRESLVADGSDIISAETAFAFRHEHIFTAQLQAANRIAGSLNDILELFERLGVDYP